MAIKKERMLMDNGLNPSIDHYAFHASVMVLVLHDKEVPNLFLNATQCTIHPGQNWVLKVPLLTFLFQQPW